MSIHFLNALLLCNLIWSAHPVMGKWLLGSFSPLQASWLRYSSALLAYCLLQGFLLIARTRKNRRSLRETLSSLPQTLFAFPKEKSDRLLLVLIGLLSFCLGPLFQIIGLSQSFAAENALIIALEPLLTILLARVFLKERWSSTYPLALGIALGGFFLINDLSLASFSLSSFSLGTLSGFSAHKLGNLLILISLIGEACYSNFSKKLLDRHEPLPIFGTALFLGVLLMTSLILIQHPLAELLDFSRLTWKAALALVWIGPIGTAGAYILFSYVLKKVTVLHSALFLFLQPIAGVLWGSWILNEKLTSGQALGSILILIGLLIPTVEQLQFRPLSRKD